MLTVIRVFMGYPDISLFASIRGKFYLEASDFVAM